LQFLIEIHKVKHIIWRTRLIDDSRYENDAEHGWHLAMMAMILQEYANQDVNITKVIKMVLIHDIVEIDAGDAFLYDENLQSKKEGNERKAEERIFGLLPEDQREELKSLWEEFEKKATAEAKYAAALDKLEPMIQNEHTKGRHWQKHGIRKEQVVSKNKPIIKDGSLRLWEYAEKLIASCVNNGYLSEKKRNT
jgi:putative hydrolase of HD superfamily